MLIHIDKAFKYNHKSHNSAYLTLIPKILISGGI